MKQSNKALEKSLGQPREDRQTNKKLLFDSLDQIDLSQFKSSTTSTTSPTKLSASSYDNLYDVARSIIDLNVAKDFSSAKDRDEYDEKLTKLLQICQTIIDFLLVDGGRRANSVGVTNRKNEINSYNNNLLQENAKLRKLLTLQQKTIAFRRANLWSVSDLNSAVDDDEEDVTTSAAVENLPEDSKSVNSVSVKSGSSNVGLQCVYCPKIFNDSNSFAKHLSLRHLSSSIDDGLPSSIISSGTSFLQRLQKQYHKSSHTNIDSKNNDLHNKAIIDQLHAEIFSLKAKLSETEQTLNEEKFRRQSFENDIKSDLEQNARKIHEKLLEKIEEVKFLRNEALIAADQATNANRTCNELVNRLNFSNEISQSNIIKDESKAKPKNKHQKSSSRVEKEMEELIAQRIDMQTRRKQSTSKLEQSDEIDQDDNAENANAIIKIDDDVLNRHNEEVELNPKEFITRLSKDNHSDEPSSTVQPNTAAQLKQSLRLQLISQLTTKRGERQNNEQHNNSSLQQEEDEGVKEKIEEQLKKTKKSKKPKSKKRSSREADNSNKFEPSAPELTYEIDKELTKADIHSSIENRIREYLEVSSSVDDHKTAIDNFISANSSEEEGRLNSSRILDETKFSDAMTKVHRDRDLIISQSRYDYDFVQIESSLRDLIESKVRSKLSTNQQVDESNQVDNETRDSNESQGYLVQEPPDSPPFAIEDFPKSDVLTDGTAKVSNEEPDSKIDNIVNKSVQSQQSLSLAQQENFDQSNLKSILKIRKGRNRRKSLEEFDEFDKPVNLKGSSESSSRRISFSDQVIEYAISPLESSEDSDVEDEEDLVPSASKGQMLTTTGQRRNQMFVIRSIDSNFNDFNQRYQQITRPALDQSDSDTFGGEKIYINEYSSSSSSSDEEEAPERPDLIRRRSLDEIRSFVNGNTFQKVNVEVHQDNDKVTPFAAPQPAQRKSKTSNSSTSSSDTLNSLLSDDISDDGKNSSTLAKKSTRVHELAELIERKLQQKTNQAKEEVEESSTTEQRLPPIGSVDTLLSLRNSLNNNGKAKVNPDIDYDIYDF